MVDYTRRTHIVRIPQDKKHPEDVYVDVEVLDALAFKGPMGEELVLNFKQSGVSVWIDDDTGGGNEKHEGTPTRRSHMERKKHGTNILDVEVLDAVSFRGKMGEEYILNLPSKKSSKFSTNDTSDGGLNTRRTHREKVSDGFKANPTEYVKVIRTDQVAFRTVMGKEMIIKMPSNDDPNSSDPRATTYVSSPKNYDPKNDKGPKPPLNTDKNVYVSFPKSSKGPWTGDDKISQGMLWWIRKVKAGGGIVYLTFEYKVSADTPATPREPRAKLTGMPFDDAAEFDLTDDIYKQVDPAAELIAIENPITPAMFSGLFQWTPEPQWRKTKTNGEDAANIWFINDGEGSITQENAFLPYPGTDLCGAQVSYGEAYGGSFFRCNSGAEAEAAAAGFPNTTILERGTWTNPEDAQYAANAFNATHFAQDFGFNASVVGPFTLAPPATFVELETRAVAILNIGKLKQFITEGDGDVFRFRIVVPESLDGGWKLKGQVYKEGKDFPLSSENKPLFEFLPEAKVEKPVFTEETVIEGIVNVADFTLQLSVISGGGEAGGEG